MSLLGPDIEIPAWMNAARRYELLAALAFLHRRWWRL